MVQSDAEITHYLSLSPFEFTVMERLDLVQVRLQGKPAWLEMTLILRRPEQGTPSLVLTFYGVSQCRVASAAYLQFAPPEITSMRERHWEAVHYQVHETHGLKEEEFSLLCDTFTAEVVT